METKRLYLLTDPTTHEIRYVGVTNDTEARLKDHCSDMSWLKREWVLSLRRRGLKPVLVDCGSAMPGQEAVWIKTLRTKCRLLNEHGGDLGWSLAERPEGLETRAYTDLLQRLGGQEPTALRRPRTSWLALRKARQECVPAGFAF